MAAASIPESLCAEDLLKYLLDIITGFLAQKVQIASYAADGSNVERAAQRLLEERATSTLRITIKHPHDGPLENSLSRPSKTRSIYSRHFGTISSQVLGFSPFPLALQHFHKSTKSRLPQTHLFKSVMFRSWIDRTTMLLRDYFRGQL